MSKGLENLVNISAPTSDYPYGNIKDNVGSGGGTPLDQISHADYHQTFRKLLSLAGITPNNLPDNVTNGYQYIQALSQYKNFTGVIKEDFSVHTSLILTKANINKLLSVNNLSGSVKTIFLPRVDLLNDGDSFCFFNTNTSGSDFLIQVDSVVETYIVNEKNIDVTSFSLAGNSSFVQVVLDKSVNKWYFSSYKLTPIIPNSIIVKFATGGSATSIGDCSAVGGKDLVFPTSVRDLDGVYNTSNGKFTFKKNGLYRISLTISVQVTSPPSNGIYIEVHKNHVANSVGDSLIMDNHYFDGNLKSYNVSKLIEVTNISDFYTIIVSTAYTNAVNVYAEASVTYITQ
jgi:hypothetical protein